ncbi:hypothetical protein Scep_013126 [Stephania cephalantha]|uniref:NAD-dependent epimerase/dehydratase domain-containing protein n=1 Tax=Stephania cephalantha TaxID=152367 RepID=A0AAP0P7B6_9MAGN
MKACVTGGTGYIASLLVKCLLEKGYAVNTTARDLSAAVSIKNSKASSHEHDLVVDEERWTDVEFLASEKPPVSKSLAEKAAWKYAEENHIDLITVIPSLVAGPAITSKVPSSIPIAMSLVAGNESLIKRLKSMEQESGSISITHVEDVYHITTDFEEIPAKTMLSSEKLIKEGFHFKYGIDEIYDQSIQYFKEVGILQK